MVVDAHDAGIVDHQNPFEAVLVSNHVRCIHREAFGGQIAQDHVPCSPDVVRWQHQHVLSQRGSLSAPIYCSLGGMLQIERRRAGE